MNTSGENHYWNIDFNQCRIQTIIVVSITMEMVFKIVQHIEPASFRDLVPIISFLKRSFVISFAIFKRQREHGKLNLFNILKLMV